MPALVRSSLAVGFALLAIVACKTERYVHVPVFAPPADAGEQPPAMRPDDGNQPIVGDDDDDDDDAGTDAGALTPTKQTKAEAKLKNLVRPLERAQFGYDGDALFLEAYQGGDPMCPTTAQPQPERTLIVSGVKNNVTVGKRLTSADGVKATLFDFRGDQLPDPPFRSTATAVTATVVAVTGASSAVESIELEVDVTFAQGTVKGRIYAAHCASLDSP